MVREIIGLISDMWALTVYHVAIHTTCRIGLHRKMPLWDTEYSKHGEEYYCGYCDEYFDKDKKRIKDML